MMSLGTIVLIGGIAIIAISAVAFLIWGFSTGQFKDVEEVKYKMLKDREPEPWPHQKGDDHD
jgi:nitrogen fixation-related uncharacterized protein